MQTDNRPVVAIVGAGFGGLRAARALRRAPVRVVVIDRHNYHLFQPLLYQVATAGLSPGDIAQPVRAVLSDQPNVTFRLAEVTGIDLAAQRLTLSTGTLDYDYLIVAAGGQTNFFGLDSVADYGFGLKGLPDALALRNHILSQFEIASQTSDPDEYRALLSFVVVGGGPTGVEFAGALSELVRLVLVKDYPGLRGDDVSIYLLEAQDRILPAFPDDLQRATVRTLERKHVTVRCGTAVEAYDGRTVTLASGETIAARTLVWTAGVHAEDLLHTLDAPLARLGRVAVLPTLQVPGYPTAFVIGDAAYLEQDGQPLPMVAPVAIQQAETAADNIRRHMKGEPLRDFRYKDRGTLATIGRNAAVARLGGFEFGGFLAWVLWLAVHIVQLIGFRNRLMVLINWAWDYFFFERGVRIITAAKRREPVPAP